MVKLDLRYIDNKFIISALLPCAGLQKTEHFTPLWRHTSSIQRIHDPALTFATGGYFLNSLFLFFNVCFILFFNWTLVYIQIKIHLKYINAHMKKSKQVKKYIFSLTDVENIKTCDNKEKQNLRAYHCYEMYFKIGFAKLWNHDTVIVEYCDMKQETKKC